MVFLSRVLDTRTDWVCHSKPSLFARRFMKYIYARPQVRGRAGTADWREVDGTTVSRAPA